MTECVTAPVRWPTALAPASPAEPECSAQQEEASRKAKKHSGPRKRRAKKKTECAAPAQAESGDSTNSANDDIEALLQRELTLAARFGVEEDEENEQKKDAASEGAFASDALGFAQELGASSTQAFAPPTQREPGAAAFYYRRQGPRFGAVAPVPPPPPPPLSPPEFGDAGQPHDRAFWTEWVIEAAEKERARRLNVLKQLQREEEEEVKRRRKWAIAAIEREQEAMMREMFLDNMKNTQWFQSTISRFAADYEVVCPNSWFGCMHSCMLQDLGRHLASCVYRQVPDTLDQAGEDSLGVDFYSYDVVCPNAVLGCNEICAREHLAAHLASCPVNGISREKEWEERLEGRRHVLLATEQERARRVSEQQQQSLFSFSHLQLLYEEQTAMMQVVLHDEIVDFCEHEELAARRLRPWIRQAVATVTRAIQELWGAHVVVEGYGSFATRLHGGHSDVDLVVFGVAAERGLSGQQCVSALAAHLAPKPDFVEVSAITKASIPLLKTVVLLAVGECDGDNNSSSSADRVLRVPFDITFDDPQGPPHNGVASAALVSTLLAHFDGLRELALVLKYFLAKRGVNDPSVGGLSSYGLLLMILFVLQEQGALVAPLDAGGTTTAAAADDSDCGGSRFDAQRRKGERVAREIVGQSLARQQRRSPDGSAVGGGGATTTKKKARRPHLPSLLTERDEDDDDSEHEAKPYLLGKYLMDFLQFYGNDFRQQVDTVSVSGTESELGAALAGPSPPGSGRSPMASPPATCLPPPPPPPPQLAHHEGLLVIRDPLHAANNVGKSCYRVSQVCRDFSDFLSFLTALIVRGSVMTRVKKKKRTQADAVGSTSSRSDQALRAATLEPHSPSTRVASHRILTSVFEMKTRDTRASLDLSS
ncbi:hypothetical protein PybrP1_003816 [[Pythium] brassicae (nom. inval.)]|nr:hypothetical protein PybrP1_003816 [[Pythium] brassicae (nom. inval.)]